MDVSATMEQLTAGMAEMATAAEHISEQADFISDSMERLHIRQVMVLQLQKILRVKRLN